MLILGGGVPTFWCCGLLVFLGEICFTTSLFLVVFAGLLVSGSNWFLPETFLVYLA